MNPRRVDEPTAFVDFLRAEYAPGELDAAAFDQALEQRRARAGRRRQAGVLAAAGVALLLFAAVPRWLGRAPVPGRSGAEVATLATGDSMHLAAAGAAAGGAENAADAGMASAAAALAALDPETAFALGLYALDEPAELVSYLDDDIVALDAAVFGTL